MAAVSVAAAALVAMGGEGLGNGGAAVPGGCRRAVTVSRLGWALSLLEHWIHDNRPMRGPDEALSARECPASEPKSPNHFAARRRFSPTISISFLLLKRG